MLREGKEIKSLRDIQGESPESKLPIQRNSQKIPSQIQVTRPEQRATPSAQSKRLSFKINNVIQKQQFSEDMTTGDAMRGRVLKGGVSLDMGKVHMNEKGADTAPTNFNKRLTSTSQDKRNLYSRGTTPA